MKDYLIKLLVLGCTAFMIAVALFVICAVEQPMPCYADTPDPDSITPPVFYANTYLSESGDVLIYFTIAVNYTTEPDDPIDTTFDFILYDTDGETVLGSKEAYNFVNGGYGETVLGFYFSAADAPTWGEEYILSVRGKPSAFDDPPIYDYEMPTSAYTSETTQAANRDEVRDNIVSICHDLSASMDVALLEQSATGQVLSDYGEELFRNVIPGLQAMVPELFSLVLYSPDYPNIERSWTENVSANYSSRYSGTPEHSAIDSFWSQMLNIEFNIGSALPVVVGLILFMVASIKTSNDAWGGLINCAMALVIASPWGVIPMAIVAIGALISAFIVSFKAFRPS